MAPGRSAYCGAYIGLSPTTDVACWNKKEDQSSMDNANGTLFPNLKHSIVTGLQLSGPLLPTEIPQLWCQPPKVLNPVALYKARHPLISAYHTFASYLDDNIKTSITPRKEHLEHLEADNTYPSEAQDWLHSQIRSKIGQVSNAIRGNSLIASEICTFMRQAFALGMDVISIETRTLLKISLLDHIPPPTGWRTTPEEEAIARSTIRQIWRDWSNEAAAERRVCFEPILNAISRIRETTSSRFSVLIPGAGLSRLAFEIAQNDDTTVIANELSHLHILATHWVLNIDRREPCLIYPWATQFSNHIRRQDQFRSYSIPVPVKDKSLLRLIELADGQLRLHLECGNLFVTPDDFRQYGSTKCAERFSCVVTAFFLDTAPNIMEYVSVIQNILKPGGTWLNIGPLLWNCFENGPGGRLEGDMDDDEAAKARQADPHTAMKTTELRTFDGKVELSWDEVIELVQRMGFAVQENNPRLGEVGYVLDEASMLLPKYQVGYFNVTKL